MDNALTPLVVVGFVVFFGIVGMIYLRNQKVKNDLRERGFTVTARVTGRHHEKQLDLDTSENNYDTHTDHYAISYQYTVNGATYSGRDNVSQNTYDILREGQPVEVLYLPERPGEARLASSL